VALYPIGWPRGPEAAPLLILVGDKDDCFPAARTQRALQILPPGPLQPRLEVLPDATHRFDDPRYAEPVHLTAEWAQFCFFTGTTLIYSAAAREVAAERVRAFLDEHL
jgi:dienelactone hydrolase